MKKNLILLFLLAVSMFQTISYAQTPEGINYQAVIRKTNGALVANTTIAIRIQIKQNSATGTVVYAERQSVITSAYGLVNFVIGQGTVLSGTFSAINWSTGNYWVSLAVDFVNGTNYLDYGSQRLMSAPYALYAKTAGVQLNQWRYGATAPAAALGNMGDFYLNTATGDVHYKSAASTWTLTGNIKGPQGTAGATGATGPQGPAGATGATGLTGAAGPQGPAGATGATGLTGAVGPQGPAGATGAQGPIGLTGATGATGATGPSGATGPAGSNGTNGTAVLNGNTNPGAGVGVNGDFYINTATNELFGPKTNGIWPAGVSLVGPQGIQGIAGPQGLQGTTGATGLTGAAGPQGPIGLTGPQGATGPSGAAGTNGAQGIQGLPGVQGPQGIQGLTGAAGLTGPAGAQGIQGVAGPAGASGLLSSGNAAGNTPYWDGSQWVVNNSNVFNNGAEVGIGTVNPNTSAKVDIESTNQGFLLPRMTTTQRNAIASPALGLQIFNINTNCLNFYTGTSWFETCGSPSSTSILANLNCGGATITSTLTNGTAASGVSVSVPYTGGNAGVYSAQSVSSTGVVNVTASLAAGTLANGAGSLTYTITGTPTTSGTASFAITVGGQSCTFTVPVSSAPVYAPIAVNCAAGATAIVNVTNPLTGKIWMDRNLGSITAASFSTDQNAYGNLYQWGRFTDGHQCRFVPTTATLSNIDQPAHGNFITSTTGNYDWRSPQNANLWQGVNGINNPCPSAYRVPTEAEFVAECSSWGAANNLGAFGSPLRWTLGGRRYPQGNMNDVGTVGYYWTSTAVGTQSKSMRTDGSQNVSERGYGFSLRCIKD